MLIDVYSVMNNEHILLPYWLRHYETFANHMYVWDDQSDDGTREMLEAHPKVTLLPIEKCGDDDVHWITNLFPQYEKHSQTSDWVIIADADEFIYHPKLTDILWKEKSDGTQVIWCRGYAMISDNPPTGTGQIYDEIKLGIPDKLESKWTIFSPNIRVRFRKGRHGGLLEGGHSVTNADTGIKLLHYRYLGDQYLMDRDRRNAERIEMVYKIGYKYSPEQAHTMPDRKRGVALEWFAKHKNEAKDVIT